MEHIALEIFDLDGKGGSRFAYLPEGTSITVTETSDIFASGDVWTFNFTLNVRANAHIFGSSGDMHGSRLHEQLDRRRARLWADGVALYLGYLRLGEEADVDADGDVDVSFESGKKTFDEMIEGAKANQVPMLGDVRFGVALWRKRLTEHAVKLKASLEFTDGSVSSDAMLKHGSDDSEWVAFTNDGEARGMSVQEYPRMVFHKGIFLKLGGGADNIDCLNTDRPYAEDEDGTPTNPYCNIALCYQKYDFKKTDKDGHEEYDYSSEPEAQRGYEVMPANRLNSAPNFFVLYWLRCLMDHLGIHIEENQMMDVEDMRRLFFVNTKCAYKEREYLRYTSDKTGCYRFSGKRLVPEQFAPEKVEGSHKLWLGPRNLVDLEKSGVECTGYSPSGPTVVSPTQFTPTETKEIKRVVVKIDTVGVWDDTVVKPYYEESNRYLHDAIATPECFPDVDISEAVKALEDGFGVRFLFSDGYQRVRIVLLRNIFRSTDTQRIACDIVSEPVKTESGIRGFRMTYGAGKDDTQFYYKGFADMMPHRKELWPDDSDKHDYSQWDLEAEYPDLLHRVSAFNKTCYVTPNNGNAYIIKVDKDAKNYQDLHPSLFGCADFMDAEDGDCTGDDETIKEVTVGFKPAIMNDVNVESERSGDSKKQHFALFVDEKMRPRRVQFDDGKDYNDPAVVYDVDGMLYEKKDGKYVYGNIMSDDGIVKPGEFAITSDTVFSKDKMKAEIYAYVKGRAADGTSAWGSVKWDVTGIKVEGHVNEGYRLYLQDNYEPNDDGVCPIETHDWGLTLGIMRGSGDDASVLYSIDPDDHEENSTWDIQAGSSATAHPDTCDNYGNLFDYNGETPGPGDVGGRFSLKLRAEKPNPKFDRTKEEGPDNRRYLAISNADLRQRGLADQFYKEYSYWIRNARIAKMEVRMTLAQLLGIDKTKRVTVGDITGFVRKLQYTISSDTGLGSVTIEIMYI